MKVLLIGFSLFNLLFLSASTHIDDRYDAPVQYCNEINPQNDVDIDQVCSLIIYMCLFYFTKGS